jgi:hypothetical protein
MRTFTRTETQFEHHLAAHELNTVEQKPQRVVDPLAAPCQILLPSTLGRLKSRLQIGASGSLRKRCCLARLKSRLQL